MRLFFLSVTLLLSLLSITGCEKKSSLKAHEVHFDRDMCARCAMVVSDRKNTVQVINPSNGKYYPFDDIGCMVLWFHDEQIPWKDKAVIWVTDAKTGKWINARTAYYDTENITPMAYGFSAHASKNAIAKDQEIIDFNEVLRRVKKIGR
ncbi:nitrous oxide reductase accessory protein NosL [Sulfurimonas sp. SWIR-19]|uniref:nitrous oxide reductase accessory protein NosL n=1 Tax=Sulfurimonas sp. SWIR-19 TaxID=2878390 RepID=UPI001CF14A81|nr:nitrous oxide reductase accessory protein NosL [Sulfurimonas sp. SWIR-19]UCN00096.1 nitrous oxide reductase accessory protein NosL [Sulfurimonas sp. SWIR-19]